MFPAPCHRAQTPAAMGTCRVRAQRLALSRPRRLTYPALQMTGGGCPTPHPAPPPKPRTPGPKAQRLSARGRVPFLLTLLPTSRVGRLRVREGRRPLQGHARRSWEHISLSLLLLSPRPDHPPQSPRPFRHRSRPPGRGPTLFQGPCRQPGRRAVKDGPAPQVLVEGLR